MHVIHDNTRKNNVVMACQGLFHHSMFSSHPIQDYFYNDLLCWSCILIGQNFGSRIKKTYWCCQIVCSACAIVWSETIPCYNIYYNIPYTWTILWEKFLVNCAGRAEKFGYKLQSVHIPNTFLVYLWIFVRKILVNSSRFTNFSPTRYFPCTVYDT